ncbi:hypothetical protein L1987_62660 [Smallanthus sonchifolius]|uniref:Uncharacterized protein n=1 Tax=Smallanthus sonchifolius TaxID=185202 RepID=A0ACB9CBC8_9ASTR|nr:hypothetical protein L1987_62660 [Smallanthus sonchifolius]
MHKSITYVCTIYFLSTDFMRIFLAKTQSFGLVGLDLCWFKCAYNLLSWMAFSLNMGQLINWPFGLKCPLQKVDENFNYLLFYVNWRNALLVFSLLVEGYNNRRNALLVFSLLVEGYLLIRSSGIPLPYGCPMSTNGVAVVSCLMFLSRTAMMPKKEEQCCGDPPGLTWHLWGFGNIKPHLRYVRNIYRMT